LRRLFIHGVLALILAGCAGTRIPNVPSNTENFVPAEKGDKVAYVEKNVLAEFEAEVDPVYRLGEGDHISVQVWNRPELTGKHVIGPDGQITLPLLGSMKISAMTREEAAGDLKGRLGRFYTRPIVSVGVDQYQANRITVLGRVLNPGILQFDRPPLLLELLARAGSLPVLDKQATLTRCAIFRGRDRIIWVDLKRLLNRGDLAYNIRLKPNDLVYIPDSSDTMVYVLGAVARPGAHRLTPDMSFLDALAQAGGPNEDADANEISLYRPGRDAIETFPFKALMAADRRVNYALEESDIIYVPKRGLAEVGYVMRQLLPGLSFMTFGLSAATTSAGR
jgi:polysaccharide export outer membrane protein